MNQEIEKNFIKIEPKLTKLDEINSHTKMIRYESRMNKEIFRLQKDMEKLLNVRILV